MLQQTDMKDDVAHAACVAGCCFRCAMRFAGLRGDSDKNPYIATSDEYDDKSSNPKRFKSYICVCCMGLLQPHSWSSMMNALREEVKNNPYDCDYYALGLSLPIGIVLREHSMVIYLKELFPDWIADSRIPLKVACKWTISELVTEIINKTLDSGSVCQFLVTLHMSYDCDLEDLECLKKMLPLEFSERKKSHRKYHNQEFSRAGLDNMLTKVSTALFKEHFKCPPKFLKINVDCFKVESCHNSIYLGGRYIKYSRELPQTPWVLDGKRIMENSIQEIIFNPLAEFLKITDKNLENHFKFLSSGREDVDVRCLGDGRPFVVELLNPKITKFTEELLNNMMCSINDNNNLLRVNDLQPISRDDLLVLKEGEEKKSKSYEALCIKLSNKLDTINNLSNIDDQSEYIVTQEDIDVLNSYNNSLEIDLKQKTPLRVLHRRPLLTRDRKVYNLKASLVEGKPNLFIVKVTTQAGTYIKEFVHGDFGRTTPNLSKILGFKVDILALDVVSINLDWPRKMKSV